VGRRRKRRKDKKKEDKLLRPDHFYIFEYGTFAPRERHWDRVRFEVKDVQLAVLKDFQLIVHYGRGIPGVTPKEGEQAEGWILSVPWDKAHGVVAILDKMRGHPAVYRRQVVIANNEDTGVPCKALTYVYRWPGDGWKKHTLNHWSTARAS
jgi:gamma-glutamylcyclotransferase (GGCT)/AIG2-like uncharacterized protein YtfP